MKSRQAILAFFCGTSRPYEGHGHVDPRGLGSKFEDYGYGRTGDQAFYQLSKCLSWDQRYGQSVPQPSLFGYDGSYAVGESVLFAYGIEASANHLFQKVSERVTALSDQKEKITVVLTAHSRGCTSALLFTKLIDANPLLKDRVNIVLDLRDPVPGNLHAAASMDIAGITTIAGQLKDLTQCTSIKSAHITVQAKGSDFYLPFTSLSLFETPGFDVLIPRFSKQTKLEVDCLPGDHEIQENESYGYYLLGLCKSLQIYSENDIDIDYELCLKVLKDIVSKTYDTLDIDCNLDISPQIIDQLKSDDTANRVLRLLTEHCSNITAIKILEQLLPLEQQASSLSSEQFQAFLKQAQILLYKDLLQNPHKRGYSEDSRSLHFGGKYGLLHKNEVTHLNSRHANLEEFPNIDAKWKFGFKGNRIDLGMNEKIREVVMELRLRCDDYLRYLQQDSITNKNKIDGLQSLRNILNQPFSPNKAISQIDRFAKAFKRKASLFATDKRGKEFKEMVIVLIVSIPLPGWQAESIPVYIVWPPNVSKESLTFRFIAFLEMRIKGSSLDSGQVR